MNKFSKIMFILLGSVLLFAAVALSKAAVGQLVLYDNFTSSTINPARWAGLQFYDPDIREAGRQLVTQDEHHRLRLFLTAYSTISDDFGSSGGPFGLSFANPSGVNEVAFTVVVNRAAAVACASNSSLDAINVEFRGNFFNMDNSTTSQVGDVLASINVARTPTDTGGTLTVAGFYNRCDDQFCGSQTNLDYRVLGYVQPGAPSLLRIKWDHPNHRFIFQFNGQPEVVSPYTVPDSTPAFGSYKALQIARVVPHCTTTPRPFTSMDASIGNVYVNP